MNLGIRKGSWFLIPVGLALLIVAHFMALIFRVQPTVSLWFPPSGVAIALTIWFGPIASVLVWFASFLLAPLWGNDGWLRWISITDATEPLVAWLIYRYYWQGSLNLKSLRDAVVFVLSAPILGCVTSAIAGSLTLVAVGKMSEQNLAQSIFYWWLGNAIGTMTIAPVALLMGSGEWGVGSGGKITCRKLRLWGEILAIIALSVATAILTVSKATNSNLDFQQFSFLNFIPIIWAATRFGAVGGTLTSSFCVVSTLIAYLAAHPHAIALSNFPVDPQVLYVHKLSLFVQCVIGLLLGTAIASQTATLVTLTVERVRLKEYQARAQLSSQLQQSNNEKEQLLIREQNARQEAERANKIKDEFLAVLSHELRTPLNPIVGWSKILTTRNTNEAIATKALETIERNARLLNQLIEDLLDVSRILQNKLKLNLTRSNLVSILDAAIDTVQLSATAKSIDISLIVEKQVDFSILADTNRMQQVFWNLLSNAIKFTPNCGQVEVSVSQSNQEGIIKIRDTGKGISPSFLPYVFERFRQADNSVTRTSGGLGLGLAIVRHIVEMHGGTVSVESPGENLGSTFTVRLPLLSARGENQASSEVIDLSSSASVDGLRVLLVEDDFDTREFTTFLLQQLGMAVTVVDKASTALEVLPQLKPDILISDIGMPFMDGYTMMRKIRLLPPEQGGKTKAIALTAYAGEIDKQQALSAGFQAHVVKPLDSQKLVQAIAVLRGVGNGE